MNSAFDEHCLTTERMVLRPVRLEEIDFVWDATRHAGFNDGMLWDAPQSKNELIAYHEAARASWDHGDSYAFTFLDRVSGHPLGRVSIGRSGGHWAVGFWTHPERQNFGYATEALLAILKFGFDDLGATSIDACYAEWNFASQRVLEKCGFSFRQKIENGFPAADGWVAEIHLRLTRAQWLRQVKS